MVLCPECEEELNLLNCSPGEIIECESCGARWEVVREKQGLDIDFP